MVRFAYRLKVDTREDLEWLLIDGSYVKAISTARAQLGGNQAVVRAKGG